MRRRRRPRHVKCSPCAALGDGAEGGGHEAPAQPRRSGASAGRRRGSGVRHVKAAAAANQTARLCQRRSAVDPVDTVLLRHSHTAWRRQRHASVGARRESSGHTIVPYVAPCGGGHESRRAGAVHVREAGRAGDDTATGSRAVRARANADRLHADWLSGSPGSAVAHGSDGAVSTGVPPFLPRSRTAKG